MGRVLEIFAIIFISFVVVTIFLVPNFISCGGRARVSSIKANMHTLQTMLEAYSVDWNGRYPENVYQLEKESISKNYYKELINPMISNSRGLNSVVFTDINKFIVFDIKTGEAKLSNLKKGRIFYDIIKKNETVIGYSLYGLGEEDNLFILDRGKVYSLTNG